MSHSHASDAAMEMPPYDTYFKNRVGRPGQNWALGSCVAGAAQIGKGAPPQPDKKGPEVMAALVPYADSAQRYTALIMRIRPYARRSTPI